MAKSYLIYGFNLDDDPHFKEVLEKHVSEKHVYNLMQRYCNRNDNHFGVTIASWKDVVRQVDVKPDTLAYLRRSMITDVGTELGITLKDSAFSIIGETIM